MIRNQNNHRKILPSVFSVASKFEDPKIPLLHPAYLVSMKQISESKSTGWTDPSEPYFSWMDPRVQGPVMQILLRYIYIYTLSNL